ncbi:MAG: hypothetical protein IK096_05745, partial [Lachnospiraceae bacterium]|nr:hypothetical protein [Lachnospiraceae bacterium]
MSKDTTKTKKALTETQVERINALKQGLKDFLTPLIFIGVIALAIFLIIKFQSADDEGEPIEIRSYAGEEEEI